MTDLQAYRLKHAGNARQFLLVALSMNLLALIALLYGDLGMVPGLLWGVGILGGAAGVSFMRGLMSFSLFVMAILWGILCIPGLNLAMLIPLYRKSEAALTEVRGELQREATLLRARERSTAQAPAAQPPETAAKPAATDHSDAIEFTRVNLPDRDSKPA